MLSTLGSFYDLLGLASSFILKDRKILQDLSHAVGRKSIRIVSNEMEMMEK